MAALVPIGDNARLEIRLGDTPLAIGRHPSNDLVLGDASVSRRHALVDCRAGCYFVRDRGSLNGLLVNGSRVSESRLRDGDTVAIGAVELRFREAPVSVPAPAPTLRVPLSAGTPRKLGCRIGRSRPRPRVLSERSVCIHCGTAATLPGRFCSGCGEPLQVPRDTHRRAPVPAKRVALPGDDASAPIPHRITPQQASLIRAVVLNRADYLLRSYYRDPATGRRVAYSLEEDEWPRFVAGWTAEPLACIRAMNQAIACLQTPARIVRYLNAAVELETLMDQGPAEERLGTVRRGIPAYIKDGYTDMGRNASPSIRHGREKIRVDKRRLKSWLVESRWRALACEPGTEQVLARFYEAVRRRMRFDESGVNALAGDSDDQSVNLSRFLDDGIGICRHLSLLYQLCLQEAAIPARVVKGTLRIFGLQGRHAWNLAWLGDRVALVDVTLPALDGPLIVLGASEEDVYRLANQGPRQYLPTADEQNHYKIGEAVH